MANYFISTTGNDTTGLGTELSPWATPQKGLNTAVNPGDTVYLRGGTYPISTARLWSKGSGSAQGGYITIRNYPGEIPVLDGNQSSFASGLLNIYGHSYFCVDGLEIRNVAGEVMSAAGMGILIADYSFGTTGHYIIRNCTIHDTNSSGIGIVAEWDMLSPDPISEILIENNHLYHNCHGGSMEAISLRQAVNFEIKNNRVHDVQGIEHYAYPPAHNKEAIGVGAGSSSGSVHHNECYSARYGIYLDGGNHNISDINIFSNCLHDNFDGATEGSGIGLGIEESTAENELTASGIRIYNNLIYHNRTNAFTVLNYPSHITFSFINNTVFQNGTERELYFPRGTGSPEYADCLVRNNILYGHVEEVLIQDTLYPNGIGIDHNLFYDGDRIINGETKTGTEFLTADPLFEAAECGDFHLKNDSPAIDSGSLLDAPLDDYSGNSRPLNYGCDLGAFETLKPVANRTISDTLLAAQRSAVRQPYLKVEARNDPGGVVKLRWDRLYTGTEPDSNHAMTMAGDGSMVRIRATPVSDNRKLYRQRVIGPGPGSDFSQWTYLGYYFVTAVTACSFGAEVSLLWVKGNGEITRQKSADNGATWSTEEYPGYAPSGAVAQMASAYKPNGDLALFFTDADTLYIIQCLGGVWQNRMAWNKTTGALSGVAVFYDGDWNLLVSGQNSAGNHKVWSVIYGDGQEVTAGNWSSLKEIATAPAGGSFTYGSLFLDQTDTYRASFSECFTGIQACQRPYLTHQLLETTFLENRWVEPVPFETNNENGLALGHTNGTAWLSTPGGVWRSETGRLALDLTADVIEAAAELKPEGGTLALTLQNSRSKYSVPPEPVELGARIDLAPGYLTSAGKESIFGLGFTLEACEYTSAGGKATLVLHTNDGWHDLSHWIARYQLRWNQPDAFGEPQQEAPVKEILAQVLARAGLRLEVNSESPAIGGFYPDFTIHAGDNGKSIIQRLLTFVPDILIVEGATAYLENPVAGDEATYSYGTQHVIYEGCYRNAAWKTNRFQVEGKDLLTESVSWEEIRQSGDRPLTVEDLNLSTVTQAIQRGEAYLRKAQIESVGGYIRVPVNCGTRLYDVIEVTDARAGLANVKRRVMGISLHYLPVMGKYEEKLLLGAV